MAWTVVGALGLGLVVASAVVAFGLAAGLAAGGAALLFAAFDGRR